MDTDAGAFQELKESQPLSLAKAIGEKISHGSPLAGEDGNSISRAVATLQTLKACFKDNPETWEAIRRIVGSEISEQTAAVQSWLLAIASGQQKANATQLAALVAYSKSAGLLVERSESVNTTIKIEITADEAKEKLLSLAREVTALNADKA